MQGKDTPYSAAISECNAFSLTPKSAPLPTITERCWNVADPFSDFARSDKNFPAADCYRTRPAQKRRNPDPERNCLIDTNLNNLSSKSRRRERLNMLLLQSGHVITRKCLYSLIGRSKYSNSAYVVPSDVSIREMH